MRRTVLWASLLLFLISAVILRLTGESPSPPDQREPSLPPDGHAVQEPPPPVDPGGSGVETIETKPVRLVVKNLADEGVLRGFGLVASGPSPGARQREFVSDADGSVVVSGPLYRQLKAASGPWRVAGACQEGDGPITLWLYEMVDVDVTVTLLGTDVRGDLTEVRLGASLLKDLGPLSEPSTRHPFTKTWLEDAGVLPIADLPRLDPDGRVRLTLPAVKNLTLSAYLLGWRPDHAVVPRAGGGPVGVALRLSRRALMVTGRLIDETGKPICDTRVVLYITQRIPLAVKPTDEEIRKAGHAFTATISEQLGYVRVTWQLSADSSGPGSETPGEFALSANVDGDALLVVMPSDRWVAGRRSLGALAADLHNLEIVLEDAAGLPELLITKGGEPLSGFEVLVVDLSAGGPQPSFQLSGSAEGTIGTSKLELGRKYQFVVFWKEEGKRIRRSGPVTWSGQEVLDVLELD